MTETVSLFATLKPVLTSIRLVVMLYARLPPSLRNVEDLLHERGVRVSHETIRFWWKRFGPMFASDITRKRRNKALSHSNWQLAFR